MGHEHRIMLPDGGVSLSRLVFGAWRLLDGGRDAASTGRLIATAVELGLTSFDHADIYGGYAVEDAFGDGFMLSGVRRDAIELVTKCGIMMTSPNRPLNRLKHYDTSAGHIDASVDQSLRALRTDYIDVLLLHRPDPLMDADETARALDDAVRAGKVRAVGVSNFTPRQFDLLQSRLPFPLVTNQIELSVLKTDALHDGTLDNAQQHRAPPMIWSPLGGGALFHSDDARAGRVRAALETVGAEIGLADAGAVAIAWLLSLPARPIPVLGTMNPARLRSTVAALDATLDRQQWFAILEASEGRPVA